MIHCFRRTQDDSNTEHEFAGEWWPRTHFPYPEYSGEKREAEDDDGAFQTSSE